MSIVKFELKEDHIKLLRQIEWSEVVEINAFESFNAETGNPFLEKADEEEDINFTGEHDTVQINDIIEYIGAIIYGAPEDDEENDPLDDEGPKFTKDQIEYMRKIYNELPTALDIIMFTGKFEPGYYKTKNYLRDWKKFTPNNK